MKTAARRKLKRSQFGLPGKRKYPMPDKAHAVNAKARAKQQRKRGKALEVGLREDRGQGEQDDQTQQVEKEALNPSFLSVRDVDHGHTE